MSICICTGAPTVLYSPSVPSGLALSFEWTPASFQLDYGPLSRLHSPRCLVSFDREGFALFGCLRTTYYNTCLSVDPFPSLQQKPVNPTWIHSFSRKSLDTYLYVDDADISTALHISFFSSRKASPTIGADTIAHSHNTCGGDGGG